MTWRCNVTCQPRRSLQMRASHACKSTAEARRAPPTPLCACGRPFLRAQSVCGGVFASGTSMFTLQRRHWGRITAAGAGGGTIIRGLYGVHSRWENTAPAVLANPVFHLGSPRASVSATARCRALTWHAAQPARPSVQSGRRGGRMAPPGPFRRVRPKACFERRTRPARSPGPRCCAHQAEQRNRRPAPSGRAR